MTPCLWLGTIWVHPCNPPNYGLWVNLRFFMMCNYKHCFLPMQLVFAMKCCTKMPCPLPHNHYCCLLPWILHLLLLICTCLISSPIACPPSSVLSYVDVYCVLFLFFYFCYMLHFFVTPFWLVCVHIFSFVSIFVSFFVFFQIVLLVNNLSGPFWKTNSIVTININTIYQTNTGITVFCIAWKMTTYLLTELKKKYWKIKLHKTNTRPIISRTVRLQDWMDVKNFCNYKTKLHFTGFATARSILPITQHYEMCKHSGSEFIFKCFMLPSNHK